MAVVQVFLFSTNVLAAMPVGGGEGYNFSYNGPEEPVRVNLVQVLGHILFSLVIVLILFYLLARFLKSRWGGLVTGKHLEITDSLPLGTNKGLYIVRLEGQFLLLGVTNNTINLLQEITNGETLMGLAKLSFAQSTFAEVFASESKGGGITLAALEAKLSGLRKRNTAIEDGARE